MRNTLVRQMDIEKGLLLGVLGLSAGLGSAAIWTAVDKKKKPKEREITLHHPQHADQPLEPLKPIKRREETSYKYPQILSMDGPLMDALESFRGAKFADKRQFDELVECLMRQASLWWSSETLEPEALSASIVREATDLKQETRAVLEEYCHSANITLKDIPGYYFRHGPVNPTWQKAFSQVLMSSDNFRHNTQIAYDTQRQKRIRSLGSRDLRRKDTEK